MKGISWNSFPRTLGLSPSSLPEIISPPAEVTASLGALRAHPGYGGSALLLAILFIVDHRDLYVRSLPVLVLPLLPSLICVGHAGA